MLNELECLSVLSYTMCSRSLIILVALTLTCSSLSASCTGDLKEDTELQIQFNRWRIEESHLIPPSSDYTTVNTGPCAVSFLCKDLLQTCSTYPPGQQLLFLVKLFSTVFAPSPCYYVLKVALFYWALKYYRHEDKNFCPNITHS